MALIGVASNQRLERTGAQAARHGRASVAAGRSTAVIQPGTTMDRREPTALRRGREFHRGIQADWVKNAAGEVSVEKPITKPSGRRGRIDVFVGAADGLVAVAEAKASHWDRMTTDAVRRNVCRQARQVWDYIESQLAEGKEVSPGIVFPRRPRAARRLQLIEALFEERGIAVVWEDESVEQRRARAELPKPSAQPV